MSTVTVRRRLTNPARKAKRRSNLSPKQIKWFGTPAQKAALKRRRSNSAKKKAVVKRHRRAVQRKVSRPVRRKNAGEMIIAGLAGNPANAKRRTMKHKSKATKTRSRSRSRRASAARRRAAAPTAPRRRRSNPFQKARRKRNPSLAGRATDWLTMGGSVLAGLLGPRFLTQLILNSKNNGILGYGVNALTGIGLSMIAGKVKGKQAANLVIAGTIGSVILRAVQDFTPFGQAINSSLKGVGDLGVYGATTFFAPLQEAPGQPRGQNMLPAAVEQRPVPVAAPSNAGVGRFTRSGRFN